MRSAAAVLLASILSPSPGCDGSSTGAAAPAGVHPIDEPGADFGGRDLAVLAGIVGDADLVALGESVHTSEGFSSAKRDIIRYLVEDLGFRAFGIESPWSEADRLTRFVATCDDDPIDAMTTLFPVWGSASLLELLTWACEYNLEHQTDPVHFFGFDMQQPWTDTTNLSAFLAAAAPAESGELIQGLSACDGAGYRSASDYAADGGHERALDPGAFDACILGVGAVRAYLDRNAEALAAASSAEQLGHARIALRSLEAWQEFKVHQVSDPGASREARDRAMADIVARLREVRFPGARAALWAHNNHIRKRGADVVTPFVGMGTHLAQALGDDYLAIGLTGFDVEVNWPGVLEEPLPTPLPSSVEAILHDLGGTAAIVDLAVAIAEGELFEPGRPYRFAVGGPQLIGDQYDAVVYLDHSGPMDALYW
jgi:erythromycin esterase